MGLWLIFTAQSDNTFFLLRLHLFFGKWPSSGGRNDVLRAYKNAISQHCKAAIWVELWRFGNCYIAALSCCGFQFPNSQFEIGNSFRTCSVRSLVRSDVGHGKRKLLFENKWLTVSDEIRGASSFVGAAFQSSGIHARAVPDLSSLAGRRTHRRARNSRIAARSRNRDQARTKDCAGFIGSANS